MIPVILFLAFAACFAIELWMGIAVTALHGDRPFVERNTDPGPYWFIMSLHGIVAIGLLVVSFFLQ